MATERQIEANKLNSQKSCGPKTEAGKAKSCLNHLSHGFTSNTATLIRGEDPEELERLLDDLTNEYQPATPTEQILVEKMCQNQWLSGRAFRFQTHALWEDVGQGNRLRNRRDLELLIRYHSAAERNFHKAHTELVKAQKERQKSEIDFESQNAGRSADPTPARGQTEPKKVPLTRPLTQVATDFPAAPAASVVSDARPDTETTPEVLKTAA
jgi:hypothetical protein